MTGTPRYVGLYKISVCIFGDCALVNTILGMQHLLYCNPPLYFAINIAQYMVSPRPPCFAIQHTILIVATSCKGQAVCCLHTVDVYLSDPDLAHIYILDVRGHDRHPAVSAWLLHDIVITILQSRVNHPPHLTTIQEYVDTYSARRTGSRQIAPHDIVTPNIVWCMAY